MRIICALFLLVLSELAVLPSGSGSINALGYVNLTVPPGLSLIANPLFNTVDSRLGSLLGSSSGYPAGAMIYLLRTNQYLIATFDAAQNGWQPDEVAQIPLLPGEGFFFRNPSSNVLTLTLVGEALQGHLTNSMPAGFSLRASMVPAQGSLDFLQFPGEPGDEVFVLNLKTQKYEGYFFDEFELRWVPTVPQLEVGQAFYVFKSHPRDWVQVFSISGGFNPP